MMQNFGTNLLRFILGLLCCAWLGATGGLVVAAQNSCNAPGCKSGCKVYDQWCAKDMEGNIIGLKYDRNVARDGCAEAPDGGRKVEYRSAMRTTYASCTQDCEGDLLSTGNPTGRITQMATPVSEKSRCVKGSSN